MARVIRVSNEPDQDVEFLRLLFLGVACCAVIGLATVVQPLIALVAVLPIVALMAFPAVRRMQSPFAATVLLITGGYMALNRGFAGIYLPLPGVPLYIGELALVFLAIPTWRYLRGRPLGLVEAIAGIWMAYNCVLTVLKLQEYGIQAIRDAATWYYVAYGAIGMAVWYSFDRHRICRWFGAIFICSGFGIVAFVLTANGIIPDVTFPFADSPLLSNARHDIAAAQMLGAAVFVMTSGRSGDGNWPRWFAVPLTFLTIGLLAVLQVRASFIGLAGIAALLLVFRVWRPLVLIGVGLLVFFAVAWIANVEIYTSRGIVSARTVFARQTSTLEFVSGGEIDTQTYVDTVLWRTIWWQALWDEALADPTILVFGRGYGPDLMAPMRGQQLGGIFWGTEEFSGEAVGRLRVPHNFSITLLARAGVLGVVGWFVFFGMCSYEIVRGILVCRRAHDGQNAAFGIWLLAYAWGLALEAMFGGVLESPFGAVPFYVTLGIGLAWSRTQMSLHAPRAEPRVLADRALVQMARPVSPVS